jgi:hypothetical protein
MPKAMLPPAVLSLFARVPSALPLNPARRFFRYSLAIALLCVASASAAKADSIVVAYTVSQIIGTEWQYDYRVSGSLLAGDDLAIFFPLATSASLVDLGTGGSDWSTLVLQPDPGLPADGEFDMVANVNNPSLTQVFEVQFRYSGSGVPGPQSFTLFDSNFDVLDTGLTQSATSAIPEPASFLLLGSGLMGLWRRARYYR